MFFRNIIIAPRKYFIRFIPHSVIVFITFSPDAALHFGLLCEMEQCLHIVQS